jgi:cytochrome c-type biogenesis protein CcmH
MLRLLAVVLVTVVTLMTPGQAVENRLSPELEGRARALFLQLRCVVCQNQSIGDSDADVARDLREIVREQITAGKSDDEIRSFLVARYGEFILLKPVVDWHTALLWGAPFLLLTLGGALAWRVGNRRNAALETANLSEAEQNTLDKIISDHRS